MTDWQAPAAASVRGSAYEGRAGATRTESLHLRQAGGALRSAEVYRVVNVATHPELKPRVLSGQLNRLEDGSELAVTFVYHDPTARRFALVIPPALAHLELKERARLMTELAEDSEHLVPEYAREGVTVLGVAELHRYLGATAESGAEPQGGSPQPPAAVRSAPDPAGPRSAPRPALQPTASDRTDDADASGAPSAPAPALEPTAPGPEPHPAARRPVFDPAAPRSRLAATRNAASAKPGLFATLAQLLQSGRRAAGSADVAISRLSRAAISPAQRHAFSAGVSSASPTSKDPAPSANTRDSASVQVPATATSRRPAGASTIITGGGARQRGATPAATHDTPALQPASPVYAAGTVSSSSPSGPSGESAVTSALPRTAPASGLTVPRVAPAPLGHAGVRFRPSLRSAAVKAASAQKPSPGSTSAVLSKPAGSSSSAEKPQVETVVPDQWPSLQERLEALPVLGMTFEFAGEALKLFVKLDAECDDVYDDEAELLVQCAQVQGRPLVVLALLGAGNSVARAVLDGLAPLTQAMLQRLARDFRAKLVVCTGQEQGAARPIFAPRESNARAIAARLAERSWQPQGSAADAIGQCLKEPLPVRDPRSPFGPARLPPPSACNVLASVAQLAQWLEQGCLEDATFVYSVPRYVIDAWQRRVLRSAHSFGVAVPERLLSLVQEQELATDRVAFVREQLVNFASRVERGQNDLDPDATQRNWEQLTAQADAFGVPIDPAWGTLPSTPANKVVAQL